MKFLRRNEESKRSINSNTFLLFITIGLFAAMYIAGMIIFEDKGFAKPQMFLNLFISNAGLLVIAVGQADRDKQKKGIAINRSFGFFIST